MKKLIMLSFLALGTLTTSASNNAFKNYYSDKSENPLPFEFEVKKRHVVRQVNLDANGGIYETILVDETLCLTPTGHSRYGFIINEMYIITNPSGFLRIYNVYDLGRCLEIGGPIIWP